jgi:DNA modification methylase
MTREKTTCEIMIGHAIDRLRTIPDESIDLVVTSPPYWGLRDYKTEPVIFGGELDCEHTWGETDEKTGWNENVPQTMNKQDVYPDNKKEGHAKHEICRACGAWRGQLGLEASPELFVAHLVEIFEECRRILKPTGNMWVNLGDSYMRKQSYKAPENYGLQHHRDEAGQYRPNEIPEGYKRKDLVGLPWLFAFAARRAGWYLRNDIVWAKSISGPHYRGGVCMPEPIKDRCTRSHEFFFHFAKKDKYYYDVEATAEPLADPDRTNYKSGSRSNGINTDRNDNDMSEREWHGMTRNMRTVWHFNPQPYDGAHFAVYPKHLIEPIVRASTSEHGCCGDCGVPWVREVEHIRIRRDELDPKDPRYRPNQYEGAYADINGKGDAGYSHNITKGWRPNCECHGKIVKQEVIIPGRAYQGDWKRDADSYDGVAGNHGGNTGLQELAGKWGADSKGEYNGVAQKDYTAHMAEDASAVKSRIIDNLTKEKTKNIYVYESDMPLDEHPVVPAMVLDPFSGSGTSGIVALEHGRSYIGIELNPEYAALSERRLKQERTNLTTKKYREEAVSLKEYW